MDQPVDHVFHETDIGEGEMDAGEVKRFGVLISIYGLGCAACVGYGGNSKDGSKSSLHDELVIP